MKNSVKKKNINKRDDILRAASDLFLANGYEKTSIRQIVKKARASIGSLYFHFPNKQSILELICKNFIDVMREQIFKVSALSLRPEVGFALDLRIGYYTTLEDPRLSQLWLTVRNIPEIHQKLIDNKKLRLKTFFGDRIPPEELDYLAIATQGITDAFYAQRKGRNLDDAIAFGNAIIVYSLKLIGYSPSEIEKAIKESEEYIKKEHIRVDEYFKYQES